MGSIAKAARYFFIFIFSLAAALLLGACRGSEETARAPEHSSQASYPVPQTPAAEEPVKDSEMAVLRIDTEQGAAITSKEQYVPCMVSAESQEAGVLFRDAEAGIRIRGNSTATAEKKPYRLRFEKKQSLLGLNDGAECKNWCLMADYFDPSMTRTSMAFRLGNTLLEGKYYCSDSAYAEVYLNGEYQGVYLVCEQTQINPNRVAIYEKEADSTETDIGYLMIGQGGRTDEPNTVKMHADVTVTDLNGDSASCGSMIFSLSGGDYTAEQIRFIEDWCSAVYEAVHAAIYLDEYFTVGADCTLRRKTDFPENASKSEKQQATIGALIDLEAAVRMYVLDEIVKNLDAGTFNMYVDFSPSGSGLLTFAAPWDFDFALGNTRYDTTYSPYGLYAANFSYSDGVRTNSWYVMLNSAGWFRERVRALWREKYPALLADAEEISRLSQAYEEEFARNYEKWDLLGKKLLFHQHDSVTSYTSQADAARFLSSWLKNRLEWLNSEWGEEAAAEAVDFTSLDLTKHYDAAVLGAYHCCEGVRTESGYVFTVTDPHDPYFSILYSRSEEPLSANVYRYFEVTCMAPPENSLDSYTTEFFLASGETGAPEAGKSVYASFPADGSWHTLVLDLSQAHFWAGAIHTVRVDFFGDCTQGDVYFIKSARLLQEAP